MKVIILPPGPEFEQRKKQAQRYIADEALKAYTKHLEEQAKQEKAK